MRSEPAEFASKSPPDSAEAAQPAPTGEHNDGRDTVTWAADSSSATWDPGPRIFGDYRLERVLGRGGMGIVYQAHQISLNRPVAVKMILAGRLATDDQIQRFYTEAQSAGRLQHEHIVDIYQFGEIEGHHYYSMELIEGQTLADFVRPERLPPSRAARYVRQVARAVHYAHQQGVLHRDLKPANVIIDQRDMARVTDFGLARPLDRSDGLTATGAAVGTPAYMAPEQACGQSENMGRATDVYALGAMLYELLTGRPPFTGESTLMVLTQVVHEEPKPPSELVADCPRDLETICLKCLQKNPQDRYATAHEVAEELARAERGEPIQAKPISRLRRSGRWLAGVPLIAAVLGRRAHLPSRLQNGLHWAILIAPLLIVLTAMWNRPTAAPMPERVRVAAGPVGGSYYGVAHALAGDLHTNADRPVEILKTQGSWQNLSLLRDRKAELALAQAELVDNGAKVVAPLYYEPVFVLARRGSDIRTVGDLAGRSVLLGPPGSGMRGAALRLLGHHEVDVSGLRDTTVPLSQFASHPQLEAAVITSGVGNPQLRSLLASGEFRVVPLSRSEAERLARRFAAFKTYTLTANQVPAAAELPPQGVPTVATVAVLTTRDDAPDRLVKAALRALYSDSPVSSPQRLIPLTQARSWTMLDLHPAAREFYAGQPGSRPPRTLLISNTGGILLATNPSLEAGR